MKKIYKGIECDSQEEVYFLQWLYHFRDFGAIGPIERSKSFLLSKPLIEKQIIQLKTKTKEKEKTILHGHVYTPEFKVKYYNLTGMERREHTPKDVLIAKINSFLEKLFITTDISFGFIDDIGSYAYFEVKPEWDQNNMTRLFKINQKWVYEKYKVFVNLVKPIQLFEQTFIPSECWSDFFYKVKTKKNNPGDKKYDWEYRTFEQWIKTI